MGEPVAWQVVLCVVKGTASLATGLLFITAATLRAYEGILSLSECLRTAACLRWGLAGGGGVGRGRGGVAGARGAVGERAASRRLGAAGRLAPLPGRPGPRRWLGASLALLCSSCPPGPRFTRCFANGGNWVERLQVPYALAVIVEAYGVGRLSRLRRPSQDDEASLSSPSCQ